MSRPFRGAGLLLGLAVLGGGCGGGGQSNSTTSSQTTQFVIKHNAQFNNGLTVRWAALPIRVALNGLGTTDEVTAWSAATSNAVTFAFVDGSVGNGISMRASSGTDVCGVTTVDYNADGTIHSAETLLAVAIYRSPQCVRTVTHETGHGIGFLNHTMDGGLMDADGGNGQFTTEVVETIQGLYALPPGTNVGLAERALVQRPTGRRTMTFITYPKRP